MKKTIKNFLFVLTFMVIGINVGTAQTAPTQTAPKTEKKAAKKSKKNKATAMYECPMKCEKPSASAGKCKKCGMDLVAVKK